MESERAKKMQITRKPVRVIRKESNINRKDKKEYEQN